MGYFHLYKSLKEENKVYLFNYDQNPFFYGVYRKLALFVSPLIVGLNPNLISFLSLFFGFIGLVASIIYEIKINYIMYFFIISFIIDFCDGVVARHKKQSSFHGRFIDGLFDILVIGFIHVILINYLFISNNNLLNINFYYITILLLPIQHLILDRYSAMARWCNEINNNNELKPYVRNFYLRKATFATFDLQQLCILLFLFSSFLDENLLINIYFALSFITSIITIILYIYLSRKFFSKTSNSKHNNE